MDTNPKARQKGLVVQETPDEVLVYDLTSEKAHCLNSSAALVWKLCDGSRSVVDIAAAVGSVGGAKVNEDFVWLALDHLQDHQLLETTVERDSGGYSRRKALRTIGLASVIALPFVASLVAPPSLLAATSCRCNSTGTFQDCVAQNQAGANCPINGCNASSVCV